MGQISELQASTIVPGLVSISDYTYNLLSTEEKQIIRRIKGKNAKWFLDFEIDLVFDSGHSWAEVKSISSLQSHQDLMMRIIDRAERLHWLIQFLNKRGRNIKLHYYFVGEHPGSHLIAKLKELNIITHVLLD